MPSAPWSLPKTSASLTSGPLIDHRATIRTAVSEPDPIRFPIWVFPAKKKMFPRFERHGRIGAPTRGRLERGVESTLKMDRIAIRVVE